MKPERWRVSMAWGVWLLVLVSTGGEQAGTGASSEGKGEGLCMANMMYGLDWTRLDWTELVDLA